MGPEADPNDPTPGMSIWGWMTPVELRWLGATAARMESIVEIGCLHGRSAYALANACAGPVFCVDPWNDVADQSFGSFKRNVADVFPNVRQIRARSPEVADEPSLDQNAPFDMVFLDGSHAYESVLGDIAAWLPRTRKVICGHDYALGDDAGFPGVARAVDEVFGHHVYVPDGTSIWVVDVAENCPIAAELPTGEVTFTDEYGETRTVNLRWST